MAKSLKQLVRVLLRQTIIKLVPNKVKWLVKFVKKWNWTSPSYYWLQESNTYDQNWENCQASFLVKQLYNCKMFNLLNLRAYLHFVKIVPTLGASKGSEYSYAQNFLFVLLRQKILKSKVIKISSSLFEWRRHLSKYLIQKFRKL